MKNFSLMLVALLCLSASAVKAQNYFNIYGSLDVALSGRTVWIDFYGTKGCDFHYTTTTNSSGAFAYPISLGTCNTGTVYVRLVGCRGSYDTLKKHDTYDTTKNGDTLHFNFAYCDTACDKFYAFFGFTTSLSTATFSSSSLSTANSFHWNFGDGGTSTAKNPVHTYAADGNYNVCVVIRDTINGCADSMCKTVHISASGTLYGVLSLDSSSNTVADSAGRVWLIKKDSVGSDIQLTAVDSTYTLKGAYFFTGKPAGHYLVKAALLPASADYADYVPTYYGFSTLWSGAGSVTITAGGSTPANIKLVKATNPGGSGFIGGLVSAGANKTGDPLEKIEVLLLNADNTTAAYTYTDAAGKYQFTNLAFGTYKVMVEIAGKPSESYTVTLDQNNTEAKNLGFDVNSKDVKKSAAVTTGIGNTENSPLKIYPNPATTEINISIDALQAGETTVYISDISGKTLKVQSQPTTAGKNVITLDTKTLSSGTYIVTVKTADSTYKEKITVR